MDAHFEFEKPLVLLEKKLTDLRELSKIEGMDFRDEIVSLEKKVSKLMDEIYANLTPWQLVQVSRHPNRPYTRDFVDHLFTDFMELHGDRTFADDQAILGGIAYWNTGEEKLPVMIIGHQKGRTTKQKMERNFGMARPEGYRKAMRLMEMADRAGMPIVTFIDTPGAYPGLDAEERGQSQAIAESIRMMFGLKVPVLSIVIGEGGSGGALAVGVADSVLMMEYSTYSVISPESCASILWNDSGLAERAAEKLKMGAKELLGLGIVDGVIEEPVGGAHRDWDATFKNVRKAIVEHFGHALQSAATEAPAKASAKSSSKTAGKMKPARSSNGSAKMPQDFLEARFQKFRSMGNFALAEARGQGARDA